jgi:hypothetical protein
MIFLKKYVRAIRHAMSTTAPKIIMTWKFVSKYATDIAILLIAKIVQMYGAAKRRISKIVSQARNIKAKMVPLMTKAVKKSPQFSRKISRLFKSGVAISLKVTKVDIIRVIDFLCSKMSQGASKTKISSNKSIFLFRIQLAGNAKFLETINFFFYFNESICMYGFPICIFYGKKCNHWCVGWH